jgi:hypothetical protein
MFYFLLLPAIMLIHSSKCNPHFLFFMAMEHWQRTTPKREIKLKVAERGKQRRRRVIVVAASGFEIPSSAGAVFFDAAPTELGFVWV